MGQRMPFPPWLKTVAGEDALEEYDAELAVRRSLWKNERLLPPLGPHRMPLRNGFERLLQLFMLYTGVFVPMWAFFQIPCHPTQLAVEYVIDACFWLDIALTMRTAYYNRDHELVVDRRQIRMEYLKRRLVLDLLANFPFELLAIDAGHLIISPVFSACRLNRMLRFCRLKKVHPPILVNLHSSGPQRLVSFFPLMTHWVACVWFYIGISGPSDDSDPPALIAGRIDAAGGSSWLVRPNYGSVRLGSESSAQTYLSSLYWASSTLMKTPWVTPSTAVEKVYTCVIVCMGAIMFAVFLGQVYKILDRFDAGSTQRREKMSAFRHFCKQNKLSPALSRKVIGYAMAEWNVTRGVATSEMLKHLSTGLGGQLLCEMRKDVLQSCPLTAQTSIAFARRLLQSCTVQVCLKNEYVIGHDELARELFILVKGSLQISPPTPTKGGPNSRASKGEQDRRVVGSKKTMMQFRMLEKQGAFTGLWSPFENGLRYPFEVRATEFTTMLNIGRPALLEVMSIFDADRPNIERILQAEYDLVEQALRLNGKNRQASRGSWDRGSRDETTAPVASPKETEEEEARKTNLKEVKTTLTDVGTILDEVADVMSEMKEMAATLPSIMEKLGHKLSTDKIADLRNSMTGRRSYEEELTALRKQQRIDAAHAQTESREGSPDGKRQITATCRRSGDAAAMASVVM